METPARKTCLSDLSDDEGAFVTPSLSLMDVAAPQRHHDLREVFGGLRSIARGGLQWRMLPNDLPPWEAVSQQTRRWMAAGVFDLIVHDLRALVRVARERPAQPTAAIPDSRTLRSTPERGARAGSEGAKRREGGKVHVAVDTLGQLLALPATPANAQDRDRVGALAAAVQAATGQTVARSPSSIRGTPGRTRRSTRPTAASGWRWSSCQRPSAASSCCRGAGWSSAPSPGRRASAGSRRMTNGCRRRSLGCTSSPSRA